MRIAFTQTLVKKEIEMINKKTETNNQLDVRIILAVLWAAGMLSSLNGDTYRLSGMTEPFGVSSKLLSGMAILLVGHVFMSVFSLTLRDPVNRWVNRSMGVFYALIIVFFWVNSFVSRLPVYEVVWASAQLVFALLVIWYAWKWPTHDGKPE
jgi:hypothetical protein